MRRIAACVLFMTVGILIASPDDGLSATNLLSKEVNYQLQLKDGTKKVINLWYQANLIPSVKVTGDNASFFHPVDTRRYDVTVSSVINRALGTSKGIEILPDDKFYKLFPIESKGKVFQNFSWFAQTNRDKQINAFAKHQIPVLAADLDAKLEQIILEDEPAVIQELQQKYNPLQITKLEDQKK